MTMEKIELKLNDKGRGGFYLFADDKQIGEMEIGITNGQLVVYHTKVDHEKEGKGYAKKLLDTMVEYARKNNLQVVPLCPYVLAQFKRRPQEYSDLWKG
jgi:predicted GNAT family acetyltransferase